MAADEVASAAITVAALAFLTVVTVDRLRASVLRHRLARERRRAWQQCPCGRRAVTAVTEASTVWLFGRCASHAEVPVSAVWTIEVVTGARVGARRPMLDGERWGEPIACAVPVREEER